MKKKIISIIAQILIISTVILIPNGTANPLALTIDCPSIVDEGETFQALVTSNNEPVEGASIFINWAEEGANDEYYTNEQGIADITAPFIDVNTRFAVSVVYGDVGSNGFIWVMDRGSPQLIITSPSSVEEKTYFEIRVTTEENGPVEDAQVYVQWNPFVVYTTNQNGFAQLEAPSVDDDTSQTMSVFKDGFISGHVEILILHEVPQLIITSPSTVLEGNPISISISSENSPVYDVLVIFNEVTYTTNDNGIVTPSPLAPEVSQPQEYEIRAIKINYQEDRKTILITNSDSSPAGLSIQAPVQVIENQVFNVIIKETEEQNPIQDVVVDFAGIVYSTDELGSVSCTAPTVQEETEYIITASKTGYESATITITVVPRSPPENQNGIIFGRVINFDEIPIEGVSVCLSEVDCSTSICRITNEEGEYRFHSIPPGQYIIRADAEEYNPYEDITITVENQQTMEINIQLENTIESEHSSEDACIEYNINSKILDGTISAKVTVNPEMISDSHDAQIQFYQEGYDIVLKKTSESNDIVSFTISAADDSSPTYVLVSITDEISPVSENFHIIYNGKDLSNQIPITQFLNADPDEEIEPGYVILQTSTTTNCAIYTQGIENTITISSLSSQKSLAVINTSLLSLYIIIIVAFSVLFTVPLVRMWKKIE